MKRFTVMAVILMACSGCATVLDILSTDYDEPVHKSQPQPKCNFQAVGHEWMGQTCLEWDDGSYRWTEKKP